MSSAMACKRSNENKMSDGGRERASVGVKVWKSYQNVDAERSAVRSIAWLDLLCCIGNEVPLESLSKITEALIANPVRSVGRSVAVVQNIRIILCHELGPAESAMIVVVSGGWLVAAMYERNSHEVVLLVCKAPIFVFSHGVQEI